MPSTSCATTLTDVNHSTHYLPPWRTSPRSCLRHPSHQLPTWQRDRPHIRARRYAYRLPTVRDQESEDVRLAQSGEGPATRQVRSRADCRGPPGAGDAPWAAPDLHAALSGDPDRVTRNGQFQPVPCPPSHRTAENPLRLVLFWLNIFGSRTGRRKP